MAVELAIEEGDCRRNRFQFLLRWIVVGLSSYWLVLPLTVLHLYSVFARICSYRTTKEMHKLFEKKNVNLYFI